MTSCTSTPQPGGDALLAAGLHELGLAALLLGHGLDDGDLTLHDLVVEIRLVHLLLHLAHAGQHAHHALHAAELLHLLELLAQVVHVEAAFHHPLRLALGRLALHGLGGFLDQADDVAHAEDAAGDAIGVELFERVDLLADADEFDRLAGHMAHGERGAAAAVAVHPGQHHAGDADALVELASRR